MIHVSPPTTRSDRPTGGHDDRSGAGKPHARTLRIAHVSDFYLPRLGGIERHVGDLASAQRTVGHDVDVVTTYGRVEGNEGSLGTTTRTGSTFESFSATAIAPARAAILDGGYDVVHVHAGLVTPLSFAVASTANKAGIPTVVTMHSMVGGLAPLYRAADATVRWRDWSVVWTAVSRTAAAQVQRTLGRRGEVVVLPNAIDIDVWRHQSHDEHAGVTIAAVMRLAPRKRAMPLLEMLHGVRRRISREIPVEAVVIGDGAQRSAMQRFIRRHRMASWVQLLGACDQDRIREVFRRADVFVAPAVQESFGIAALEARAAGLPVVAMRRSGIAEFIDHGRSGLLARSDHEMVDALATLATDRALRSAIAEHNREISPGFGWAESLQATQQVYELAAARQPAASRIHHAPMVPVDRLHALPVPSTPRPRIGVA